MAEIPEAGWHPDPVGRHRYRYHDGVRWTDHASDGGDAVVDPLWSDERARLDAAQSAAAPGSSPDAPLGPPLAGSPPVSSSTPATSGTDAARGAHDPADPARSDGVGDAPGSGGGLLAFVDSLGDDTRVRPRPDLSSALGGLGGAFVATGLVVVTGQSGDRGPILVGGLIAVALAYVVALVVAGDRPWSRSPAVGALVVGLGVVSFALVLDPQDTSSDGAVSGALVLAGILHVAAWLAPGFRGRPLLLGLGLAVSAFGVAGLIGNADSCDGPFDPSCEFGSPTDQLGYGTAAGVFLAIVGTVLLVGVRWLDRHDRPGIATTVAAASIVLLVSGAALIASDLGETGGAVLITITGATLGIVGHLAGRRGLTWTGAILAAFGALYTAFFGIEPTESTAIGLVFAVTGAVVIAAPLIVQAISSSNSETSSGADAPQG